MNVEETEKFYTPGQQEDEEPTSGLHIQLKKVQGGNSDMVEKGQCWSLFQT